eukprot:scaffold5679_cov63-Cyclotella_meneghiniana.AAC.3
MAARQRRWTRPLLELVKAAEAFVRWVMTLAEGFRPRDGSVDGGLLHRPPPGAPRGRWEVDD